MYILSAGLALFACACILSILLAAQAHRRIRAASWGAAPVGTPYLQYLEDKRQLNAYGYAQLLRRGRSGFGSFSMSFATMSVFGCAALYFGPVYELAGPWAFGLGLPLVALFAVIVGAATAELAGPMPTAGACYHWSRVAGGRRWGRGSLLLRTLSDISMLALLNGAAAVLIDRAAGSWLGYSAGGWSVLLWTSGLLVGQAAAAALGRPGGDRLLGGVSWLQVGLVVAIVAGLLLVFEPGLQPAAYLFSAGAHGSGDYSWLQLAAAVMLLQRFFVGADNAAAGSEESSGPSVQVPWGIYLSTVYGFILAYVLCVFVTLSITGPVAGAGGSGLFLALISDVWGWISPYASVVLHASLIVCLWASGLGVLTASSRQWFAYHRDGRTSWSRWLQHIDSRRQTPQRLILLLAAVAGGAAAVLWLWQPWAAAGQSRLVYLSAASTIAFNLSLLIPLALHYRKPAPTPERGAPYWQLGRLSRPLRLTAILWLLTSVLGAATLLSPTAGGHLALILLSLLLLWPLARLLPGRWRVEAPPGRAELLAQERGYRQL